MLAELFGSNEESKAEVKPASVPASSVQNKSGWLDLKNDSPEKAVSADLSSTKKYGFENEPRVISTESSASTHDRISTKSVPDVGEKSVHFVDNHGNSGRRKSEASPALTRKTKPHFKSLDLNLDFDFDTTSADDFVPKSSSTSAGLSVSVDDGGLLVSNYVNFLLKIIIHFFFSFRRIVLQTFHWIEQKIRQF